MYLCHLQRWILLHGLFIPTDCCLVPYAKGNLMNCRWHGTHESLKSLPTSWNHTEKTVRKRSYAGWWLTYPSEKYESQWEGLSHILGKIKNVWNHQPVYQLYTSYTRIFYPESSKKWLMWDAPWLPLASSPSHHLGGCYNPSQSWYRFIALGCPCNDKTEL